MNELEQLKMQLEFAHESTKRVTVIYTDEINRVLDECAALKDALVQAGVTEKRLKEHAQRVNNANDKLVVENAALRSKIKTINTTKMTSKMIIAALRSGADDLDAKPSVTNTFYGALMRDSADRISDIEKIRDFWQKRSNTLRAALIDVLDATQDDDGKWVDRNGDYVDALNAAIDSARKEAQP